MNKPALAKHFKLSLKSIDNWVLKGCPCRRGPKGQYIFDLPAVERWRHDMLPARTQTTSTTSYTAARARKETALAALRELQLKERTGELVEREAVERVAFATGRRIRDSIENLPARLSGLFAAESDQSTIFQLFSREIQVCLEGLTNDAPDQKRKQ